METPNEQPKQSPIQITKLMNPVTCPHCQKEFWTGWEMMTPKLSSVFTTEEAEKAQAVVKERVEKLEFNDPKIKEALLNNIESTPLTEADVEPFYQEILKSQLIKSKETPTEEK